MVHDKRMSLRQRVIKIVDRVPLSPFLYKIYGSYLLSFVRLSVRGSILRELGWFRSSRERSSVDRFGNPIPWITYSTIAFLKDRVRPEMNVFEYGAGNSTLWWAERTKQVVSIEHDLNWFKKINSIVPPNAELHHIALDNRGTYAHSIQTFKQRFDIVMIDGRDRNNCARNAIGGLTPQGVIVWDNTNRQKYQEGYLELLAHGFKRLDFVGLAPIGHETSVTTIFYRDGNCLKI